MWAGLRLILLKPGLKILVTGRGPRGIRRHGDTLQLPRTWLKVSPEDFLTKKYEVPVVCQIGPQHYVKHIDGRPFDFNNFVHHPE
ncbi:MAG: hypothetical protein MZU84_00620 [Sphingobacterium sp.]|nr:hypothetical protein [Sphingobacterium sp.]